MSMSFELKFAVNSVALKLAPFISYSSLAVHGLPVWLCKENGSRDPWSSIGDKKWHKASADLHKQACKNTKEHLIITFE